MYICIYIYFIYIYKNVHSYIYKCAFGFGFWVSHMSLILGPSNPKLPEAANQA